ncbi:sphingosine-1-phosphate phosphatase [Cavenderia fasciculata]|uniref:Sphingosine-1-phosphate phosphatase n=1 Tax=Cavenderia fasciculata TaxID=261658 RepID=F4QE45_CACFS|nr:sphingosine-1-phosphate phosphatase [Cavenderia fasciculata]EGG13992.1 sphingosine-1-phosphate phosphatase [Cavenderia fasciculata]|eukprot:XP_004350700.1 sphingosine-1-phosphate phosphatase [Cavenderia fasciculata]
MTSTTTTGAVAGGNKNKRKKDGYLGGLLGALSTNAIREVLLKEYEREIPIVLKIQSYRTKLLDYYFSFASLLGEEFCYILLLPITAWVISRGLAIDLTFMLALSIGTGNILKNTFTLPRPVKVWTNTAPQKDHGLPSTHTSSSIAIQFYYFMYFYHVNPNPSHQYLPYWIAIIPVMWSVGSVMLSRLYNGHHTPMDVTAGAIIGFSAVFTFVFGYRPFFINLLADDSFLAPMVVFATCCVVLFMHPQLKTPTPAYPETGLVVGTFHGSFLGGWIAHKYNLYYTPDPYYQSSYAIVNFIQTSNTYLTIARILIGIVLVLLIKDLSKKLFYYVFNNLVAPIINRKKQVIQPMVEAFQKLFTYSCVSGLILLSPTIFYHLNIMMPLDYDPIPNTNQQHINLITSLGLVVRCAQKLHDKHNTTLTINDHLFNMSINQIATMAQHQQLFDIHVDYETGDNYVFFNVHRDYTGASRMFIPRNNGTSVLK